MDQIWPSRQDRFGQGLKLSPQISCRLQQWEKEINVLENPRVSVENNADLEGPPRHMTYVTVSKVWEHGGVIK